MTVRLLLAGTVAAVALALASTHQLSADASTVNSGKIKHVLLLSIDGMHAVDLYNCMHGIAGANDGNPYCPNMASLSQTAINYVATASSMPSDSVSRTRGSGYRWLAEDDRSLL